MSLPTVSARLLAPLLLGLLLPGTLPAQQARAATPAATANKTPGKGEEQALAIFNMLDTNGDGRISRAEAAWAIRLKPSLAELFREADLNGDGYLTQEEIRTVAERRRAERLARRERERQQAGGTGNPAIPAAAVPPR